MLRKIFLGLTLSLNSFSLWAISPDTLSLSFDIIEKKCPGGCFYLQTSDGLLGSLLPMLHRHSTYHFFDEKKQLGLTLKFTAMYWSSFKFDIFDRNHTLIAKLEEISGGENRLLRFNLYAPDGKTVLAVGRSNLFGTEHTIYAGHSQQIIAVLTRPLFTWSRDSAVTIMDKAKLASIMDPNVFAAVLALHCHHDFGAKLTLDMKSTPVPVQNLREKIENVGEKLGLLDFTSQPSEEKLQAASNILNQQYQAVYDDSFLDEEEKVRQFIDFGCELLLSQTFSPEEAQAMVHFMLSRIS